MKKRKPFIVIISLIVVLTMVILVQPIQSFAIEALSVFRVRDVNAINITIGDIEQLAEGLSTIMEAFGAKAPGDKAHMPGELTDFGAAEDFESPFMPADFESPFTPFDSPDDFDAFNFKLPRSLRSETPQLLKLDGSEQSLALNTGEINAVLAKLDALPLPDVIDGREIEIKTPAVAVAVYSGTVLIATQAPVISGDEEALDALSASLLSLPMLSYNLRSPLAAVDLRAGIVYVPVIEGFGRRTTIRNSTGYLYALSDLEMLLGSLQIPGLADLPDTSTAQIPEDAQALIWATDSVLYILISAEPASELVNIAGSVR